MSNSIVPITPGILELISQGPTGITPFTQEIMLLEIVVAGTTFCSEIKDIEPQIEIDKVLTMKRQPNNEYDKYAIGIYCDAIRVGFVPADMNEVCSRLMDAGKMFFCRVTSKEWVNNWLKIEARIIMVE